MTSEEAETTPLTTHFSLSRLPNLAKSLFNLSLSPAQVEMFRIYAIELAAWNKHTNLTAITEPEAIEIRHFVDSLSCLMVSPPVKSGLPVIDVGTGAGFPGLPLKIVHPAIDLTLLEATGKKARFLEHLVSVLGLKQVTIIHDRAEALGQNPAHRERYQWVLARAVAGMRTLAEYLLPLCAVGGQCLAQKGESTPQEVVEAQAAIKLLGGHVRQLTQVELPTVAETRYLVRLEKVATTPPSYPRRAGVPAKRPL